MKLKIFLSAFIAFALSLTSYAQFREGASYEDLYDSETVSAMKAHVRELSATHLEGRKAGSDGEKYAAEYVTARLKEYGVDVLSPADGEVFGIMTAEGDTLTSRNVVAYVPGYDKKLRDHYIVVGARLDNIGTSVTIIDGQPVERVYCGANGNASGLAMLVELARMVQTNSIVFRRSVLFVAFGASCGTFAGSWYFLNRSFPDVESIDGMINLDMLGTAYNGFYAYTSSNADMNALVRTLSGNLQPVLPELVASEPYPSDHRAFYEKEIPSVLFTTGRYPEHNTDRDTQSIIDYEGMEKELEYIYNFTEALCNANDRMLFRDSGAQAARRTEEGVVSYYECDQRPTFLGTSDPSRFLEKWVYQYLKYPEKAVRDGVQGRVVVEFIIEKDGKVSDVKVTKGVSEEIDAEAVKVISASPKWKPGKVRGEKVRTSLSIPVEFRLEKKGAGAGRGLKK